MDLHDGDERGIEVIRLWLLRVEDLHREGTAGNSEDRTSKEVLRELLSIQGGRGDNEFQIWPTFNGLCNR